MEMNLQLHHVVADITGKTGMRIMRAIVQDQRDYAVLVSFRDPRCKASEETIRQSLEGHYREEHLLALRQSLCLYDTYHEHVAECDQLIEASLKRLLLTTPMPESSLPAARHRDANPNAPAFDVRSALFQVLGIDLTQIQGLGPYLVLKLISECGTDMSRCTTVKHFTTW